MSTRDITERLQDCVDLATDKRVLEAECAAALAEIRLLRASVETLRSDRDRLLKAICKIRDEAVRWNQYADKAVALSGGSNDPRP